MLGLVALRLSVGFERKKDEEQRKFTIWLSSSRLIVPVLLLAPKHQRSCYEIPWCGGYIKLKFIGSILRGLHKFSLMILCPLKKRHIYVSRMLLLYFKTNKASFREQRFSLKQISVNFLDWSKAQVINISANKSKMKNMRVLYFLELLKFLKTKWSHFHFWPLGRD